MSAIAHARNMVGYGQHPPHAAWPGNAKIAVQVVLNYEEGGERCVLNGDSHSETFLSEIIGAQAFAARHKSMESLYEYGSRAGVWRLLREFAKRQWPLTVFGVGMALESNLEVAHAMVRDGHEIASHGWRWISYQDVDIETERQHMQLAVESLTKIIGRAPLGWYTGRDSPNTRRLVVEHGGFLYDADSYADDLPYWELVEGQRHLIVPYTLDTNDMRFATAQGFNSGDQFYQYLKDAFDVLYAEGDSAPKMLSIGLHARLAGRPGRFAALQRFLDYVQEHDQVWLCRRSDIARHWINTHPYRYTLQHVSQLSESAFVRIFGSVFECSPWVAQQAWQMRPFATMENLHRAMTKVVENATERQQVELICAHPELGHAWKVAGELSEESRSEQRGAGLQQCSAEELAQFRALNRDYRAKFGFPFVVAVKNLSRPEILHLFKQRLQQTAVQEQAECLRQIAKIAHFRLQDLLEDVPA